jgi:hypothetical protein
MTFIPPKGWDSITVLTCAVGILILLAAITMICCIGPARLKSIPRYNGHRGSNNHMYPIRVRPIPLWLRMNITQVPVIYDNPNV